MKILVIGTGGVGEALAAIGQHRPWIEQMVLADYNLARAHEVQAKLGNPQRFPLNLWMHPTRAGGGAGAQVPGGPGHERLRSRVQRAYLRSGLCYGCTYMDMAMSLSEPHPDRSPTTCRGSSWAITSSSGLRDWEKRGLLAFVGMGVEPGMADVFARYAQDHLFDEIDEIGVRDGANLEVKGYEFAPNFSIWTTIEECLNPPVIWEKDRGWYTTEPFSEPEIFEFPEGIGPVECVNVEHEEVLLVPRWIKAKRVTFKYGLGDQFIGVLKTIKMLGLDQKEPIKVKDVMVAPRDVVAACLPDPAHLGHLMSGKTCAGTWVKARKDGKERQVYIYQVADNETCMQEFGVQAVVAQTAFNPVIAWDLLNQGTLEGAGVLGPEAFDAQPFMDKMADYGFPYGIKEM
jgi:saccharopine dehydrogenase (NAD+, L-lysine forming)